METQNEVRLPEDEANTEGRIREKRGEKSIPNGASLAWVCLTSPLEIFQPHVPIKSAFYSSQFRFFSFKIRGILTDMGPSSQNKTMRDGQVAMEHQGHALYSTSPTFALCLERPTFLLMKLSHWPAQVDDPPWHQAWSV